jgi:CheY-like chemotaxis protein
MTNHKILKRQILIVDDESAVRETLSSALSYDGHNVVAAASGGEALSLFEPGKFHLVMTDLSMPDMAGDELAAEIKSRAPAQPVVAITGHVETVCETQVPWFDGYIGKPFALAKLRDIIERYSVSS